MDRFTKVLEGRDDFFPLRVFGGTASALLAVVSAVIDGIDTTFLVLAAVSILLFTLPWSRLSSLRAGPFEFSLEQGQIRGAIDSIVNVAGEEKEKIESLFARLSTDIEQARGSRILWIDDRPRRVVGERRLLRSIELESEIVPTCAAAAETLCRDNDFDLVITSLEKQGEKQYLHDRTLSPGVTFVEWLRGRNDDDIRSLIGEFGETPIKDKVINRLPVIFYAAFPDLAYIQKKLQPLAGLPPAPLASRSIDDLLRKTIRTLADARSDPTEVNADKKVSSS